MLGAIIGDIVGSVYEWHNIKTKEFPLFASECGGHCGSDCGSHCFFTDDTVMTIATAEALMNGGEGADFIDAYQKWGRLYPDAGYGARFGGWLYADGHQPYYSWGNGSAMRVSPCAEYAYCCLYPNYRVEGIVDSASILTPKAKSHTDSEILRASASKPVTDCVTLPTPESKPVTDSATLLTPESKSIADNARALARTSASVTHNHPEGIKGAEAVAYAMTLGYCYGPDAAKVRIRKDIPILFGYSLSKTLDEIRPAYRFNESCQDTVPQAITAFLESTDFEDAIRNAISLGGDSDTLAAITGSIAEAAYGVPDWIREKALGFLDQPLMDGVRRWEAFCTGNS